MQMLEKARKEMPGLEKEENSSEAQLIEDSRFNEERVNVPNFGTQKEEWDLSGTIEQCIIRYASKLRYKKSSSFTSQTLMLLSVFSASL